MVKREMNDDNAEHLHHLFEVVKKSGLRLDTSESHNQ